MKRLLTKTAVLALLLIATAGTQVRAQETSNQTPTGAAPAATGPDTETQTIENPPLSGLDAPSFAPSFGARSYLAPKLQVNEAVDTNRSGTLGNNTTIKGVTRGIGSLTLQKLWKTHPLDVDYSGGVAWYQGTGKVYQLHSFAGTQRFLWRTGQLAVRDGLSYLPTGNFGFNSFGGAGVLTGGTTLPGGLPGGNGLGGGNFGSTVNQPRISNTSSVDITESLSPRDSVTLAGGYSFNDFLDNPVGYVNSQQVSGQVGFNRQLSRHDQIAFSYGYQSFHFPNQGRGSFNSDVFQVLYGHRITGRLDLQLGGGPQFIHRYFWQPGIVTPTNPKPPATPVSNSFITGSGRATLTYLYSAGTNLNLTYTHSANAGSGLLAGANTDAIRLGLTHQLTRRWTASSDIGYSYSKRILNSSTTQAGNASGYRFWYAGGTLRRQLSRHLGAFADYQYDSIGFASGICTTTPCSTSYGRHVGLIGLDWTPSPIRLE
jgi:hypothetical protein